MNENKITSTIVKGAVLGLVLVAISLVLQMTMTMEESKKFGWLQFVVLMAGIIWACIQYAQQMNGEVTFGGVFTHGFKVTALVTLILAVFTYISIKFIFPDMAEKGIELAREQMQKDQSRKMTEEQIDQAIDITRKYFAVFVVGAGILFNIIIGAVASLVGAAVAKKNQNVNPLG